MSATLIPTQEPAPAPQRSAERSKESVTSLRAILAAIRKRDAEAAEKLTREEAQHAAAEIMRLIEKPAG